jgi:hypothetical protein
LHGLVTTLPYKPDVDFEPIGAVFEMPFLIVAMKDLPPRDLHEFIAYAEGNAEKLNVGHAGVGCGTPFGANKAYQGKARNSSRPASNVDQRHHSGQDKARSAATRRADEERNCSLGADH